MKSFLLMLCLVMLMTSTSLAGPLDDLLKGVKLPPARSDGGGVDEATTVSGLKEALSIGTGNAVASVSKVDGYFANQFIKILLPEKIQMAADVLGKLGYQKKVDAFVLSMNRAAENAAPRAKKYFISAIRQMTFQDAMGILRGGDTSATDYFKSKTYQGLYSEFKPSISASMGKVGVTRSYQDMVGTYTKSVPFGGMESLDLDHYVTSKALDGLFYMIGQEEKKIRTDPAARVTDLLKTVFGR